MSNRCIPSGQIIIFHQPRFPWNKGISLSKPPFGVRSCEVAIICQIPWLCEVCREENYEGFMAVSAQMRSSANVMPAYLAILVEFSMVKTWPFERLSALQTRGIELGHYGSHGTCHYILIASKITYLRLIPYIEAIPGKHWLPFSNCLSSILVPSSQRNSLISEKALTDFDTFWYSETLVMYSHGLLINIRLQGIVPSAHGSVIFHTSDDNS